MRFFFIIFLSLQVISQEVLWVNNTPVTNSYSSPRTTDLNNDGVEDILIGAGIDVDESTPASPYGIIAINGLNGEELWTMFTRNEMFNSPQFFDYTNDNIDDVLIGGRDAELRLINGNTGELIWEFWSDNDGFNEAGWYNFYTSQIIDDQTGDGFPDILIANGGAHMMEEFELNRPPGHIMIIDGMTGAEFKTAVVPDSNETYLSPVICDLNGDNNYSIIFGTGGESIEGNLWISNLTDLLNEDLSNAIPLIPNSEFGHIAPPSIGDLNGDQILDIITQGFDGKVSAINGNDFSLIWQFEIEYTNIQSTASPILGSFSNNNNDLDVFATLFEGAISQYNYYHQILLDGENGNILWHDSLVAPPANDGIGSINYVTPIAFDSNSDGNDEALISVMNNYAGFWVDDLVLIDFNNNTQTSLIDPIEGGNVACTPQIKDIDNNGFLDIIFASQANSQEPFNIDNSDPLDALNTRRITTNFPNPLTGVAWGSYMGTNFDGQYNDGCEKGDLGLFAYPSDACPGENNGMINLYLTGGTPPYTYLWSNGETSEYLDSLGAGSYSVTVVDASGICESITREVNEYSITSFYESPSCPGENDGTIYFNSSACDCNTSFCQWIWELNGDTIAQGDGSSATETYKYLFNITSGTYTATIIHPDGCQVQEEIIVPEVSLVDDYVIIDDCSSSGDGSIELFSNIPSISINYSWNIGESTSIIENLNAGVYSVIISTEECSETLTFQIEDFFPYDCNENCINDIDNDGVCDELEIPGCTDEDAVNYDEDATDDNGSCSYAGCTDIEAINYNECLDANGNPIDCTIDDGSCIYTGCMDPEADNYCNYCTVDDGSCAYPGCTDPNACNVDETATIDDGSCEYETCAGCMDPLACNFNDCQDADGYGINCTIDDGSCMYSCWGCTDPIACNYNECVDADGNPIDCTIDDGSCEYETCAGCMDENAVNYNECVDADGNPIDCTVDDGSCCYGSIWYLDVNNDGCGNSCAGDALMVDLDDDPGDYEGTAESCCCEGEGSDLPILDIPGWPNATWAENDDCYGESIENADGQLEHHWCSGLENNLSSQKVLIMTVDILGKQSANEKGFTLELYDDGSIEKKYLINKN